LYEKLFLSFLSLFIFLMGNSQPRNNSDIIIAKGHMPAIAKDKK